MLKDTKTSVNFLKLAGYGLPKSFSSIILKVLPGDRADGGPLHEY